MGKLTDYARASIAKVYRGLGAKQRKELRDSVSMERVWRGLHSRHVDVQPGAWGLVLDGHERSPEGGSVRLRGAGGTFPLEYTFVGVSNKYLIPVAHLPCPPLGKALGFGWDIWSEWCDAMYLYEIERAAERVYYMANLLPLIKDSIGPYHLLSDGTVVMILEDQAATTNRDIHVVQYIKPGDPTIHLSGAYDFINAHLPEAS